MHSICITLTKCISLSSRLAPYREKFRRYDFRRRGCITIDEALPVLSRELGFDRSKTEAFIEIYDKNKDGEITLLEFVDFEKKVDELWVEWQAFCAITLFYSWSGSSLVVKVLKSEKSRAMGSIPTSGLIGFWSLYNFIYPNLLQDTQLQISTNIVGKVPAMD